MSLTIQAVYENGVLKPDRPLPLKESEKVKVTIQPNTNWVDQTYGIIGWNGDVETLRRIAEDPEFSILEAP